LLGDWTHDGSMLSFASNQRTPEAIDAYLYDLNTGSARLVAENQGIGGITDVSRDHRFAIVYRLVNRGDDNLYLIDLDSGEETLLTPHEPPAQYGGGQFSVDGRTVYFTTNQDRDLKGFAAMQVDAKGKPESVRILAERDSDELDGFVLTEDRKTAALLWNVASASEVEFMDLESGRLSPGPKLGPELILGGGFSRDGRLVGFNVTGSNSPLNVWAFDRETEELRQVTDSPHAGVDLDSLIQPESVSFNAHDGLPLTGGFYRPREANAPGPIVMSFHGGPEAQERPWLNSTYQALLSQGVGVFAPNIRGSSGFGKTFVNLDNGKLRFDAVRDIKSCIDFLVESGLAAAGRIGIMGGSYGGFMVTAGLTEYPDEIAAGATICGMVNFETFFENTEPWMAAISKIEYGDPETERDLLRELSPIHKIDRISSPTIVLHGANDTNVPVVEAEQVVNNLRERGVPVEYVLFPDEGHGFTKTANRVTAAVRTVRWFVEHL
jgi:dipeptidyl aminopeptidase/acylaminoacyl peptidase